MDIRKSQRLSQFLSVISDMVQYSDIGKYMVGSGMISSDEHEFLQRKLEIQDNSCVMNELLTMVNLRRGGFDIFLEILRKTDYVWVAEQLDPGKMFTEPDCDTNGSKSSKIQNVITNVRQTMTRKSEPTLSTMKKAREDDDLMFMSYRDSCPIDIPIKPSYFMELNVKRDSIATESKSQTYEKTYAEEDEFEFESKLTDLKLDNEISTSEIVLVKNLPSSLACKDSTTEYFTKLAKRLDVHSDLKAIVSSGKISKRRKQNTRGKAKLKFHSEKGRNNFITAFKEFTSSLEPSDELYSTAAQLKVSVPKVRSQGIFRKKIKKINDKQSRSLKNGKKSDNSYHHATDHNVHSESELESSKHNWYQRNFKLKSWTKQK